MAMLALMKGMGVDATPHGMRSAFNTWAKNQTNFAPETRNAALAHTEEKLEQAYTRDKNRLMFDKRRRLMSEWADILRRPPPPVTTCGHCEPKPGTKHNMVLQGRLWML